MDCDKILDNILFYLDNELTEAERIKFAAHLQECPQCKALYENVAAAYQIIEQEDQIEASPFFYHKLTTKLAAKDDSRIINILSAVLKPVAVAASITLGIIIGNGERTVLDVADDDTVVVTENFTPALPADYSLWITMNEEDGNEN